ncbi:MAG: TetR/AcrR family transcriptional regulator, partial [Paracoccaceae bacterium]
MSDASPASDRQDTILDAAFHAFATYGFRRTTMDDVATAASLSRTALYVHFRNKEDLFRQLTRRYFADVTTAVAVILVNPDADPVRVLNAVFVAKDGKFMDVVLGTPHGPELMDAGFSIAGDVAAEGEAAIEGHLASWIARLRREPDLGTPVEIAQTLMAALKGIKSSSSNLTDYRAAQG